MTVKEMANHLDEIATLAPHEEIHRLREVMTGLAACCVEMADLRHPGIAKIIERVIQREKDLTKLCSARINC